jgi:hypothetical protein
VIHLRQIHDFSLSWLGKGTSIKRGGIKLEVLLIMPICFLTGARLEELTVEMPIVTTDRVIVFTY